MYTCAHMIHVCLHTNKQVKESMHSQDSTPYTYMHAHNKKNLGKEECKLTTGADSDL